MLNKNIKQKKDKCIMALSLFAALCFFICYFVKERDLIYLMLGFIWLCISITKIEIKQSKNTKKGK